MTELREKYRVYTHLGGSVSGLNKSRTEAWIPAMHAHEYDSIAMYKVEEIMYCYPNLNHTTYHMLYKDDSLQAVKGLSAVLQLKDNCEIAIYRGKPIYMFQFQVTFTKKVETKPFTKLFFVLLLIPCSLDFA